MSVPIRGQCRRSTPSLLLPDGTEWTRYGKYTGEYEPYPVQPQNAADMKLRDVQRVDRSTQWGNPWVIDQHRGKWRVSGDRIEMDVPENSMWPNRYVAAERSVELYRRWLVSRLKGKAQRSYLNGLLDADVLSCWCPIGAPCHADVLCELVGQLKARTL